MSIDDREETGQYYPDGGYIPPSPPLPPEMQAHIDRRDNPHEVTAEQAGAYDKATVDSKIAEVEGGTGANAERAEAAAKAAADSESNAGSYSEAAGKSATAAQKAAQSAKDSADAILQEYRDPFKPQERTVGDDVFIDWKNGRGEYIQGKTNIKGPPGEDGLTPPVDAELSETSENPVQNRVIREALGHKLTAETDGGDLNDRNIFMRIPPEGDKLGRGADIDFWGNAKRPDNGTLRVRVGEVTAEFSDDNTVRSMIDSATGAKVDAVKKTIPGSSGKAVSFVGEPADGGGLSAELSVSTSTVGGVTRLQASLPGQSQPTEFPSLLDVVSPDELDAAMKSKADYLDVDATIDPSKGPERFVSAGRVDFNPGKPGDASWTGWLMQGKRKNVGDGQEGSIDHVFWGAGKTKDGKILMRRGAFSDEVEAGLAGKQDTLTAANAGAHIDITEQKGVVTIGTDKNVQAVIADRVVSSVDIDAVFAGQVYIQVYRLNALRQGGGTGLVADALRGCVNLTDVYFDTYGNQKISVFGDSCCKGCGKLRSFNFRGRGISCSEFGDGAFLNCSSLLLTDIAYLISKNTASSVTIGKNAFFTENPHARDESPITVMPDNIISIGENGFRSLPMFANVGAGVKSVGLRGLRGAFHKSVKAVTIPKSLTQPGGFFMEGNYFVESVVFESGSNIYYPSYLTNAFNGCESLSRITIPKSQTSRIDGALLSGTMASRVDVYMTDFTKEEALAIGAPFGANPAKTYFHFIGSPDGGETIGA